MKNTSQIIRRADITKNFSIIPNHIAQSKSLTPEEKSLLIHLLSMPNDWYYIKTRFWRETNLGRTRFNTAWKGLENKGFIKSEKIIGERNLIKGYNYIISDEPIFGITEIRTSEGRLNQPPVNPKAGKQTKTNNTKNLNTKKDLKKTLDTNSKASIGVSTDKSFLETFYDKNKRYPNQSELYNFLNQ